MNSTVNIEAVVNRYRSTKLPVHLKPWTDLWDWQLRAKCRGVDPEIFFPPTGERGRALLRREAKAKAVCEGCPVLASCQNHAMATREPYGIWGGLTTRERAIRAFREEMLQGTSSADERQNAI